MLNGIVLGFMTYASLVISFLKLPNPLRALILKYKFVTDILAFVFVFLTLSAISKSLVAIIAATFSGLLVGLTLEGATFLEEEPEMRERLLSYWNRLIGSLKHYIVKTVLDTLH